MAEHFCRLFPKRETFAAVLLCAALAAILVLFCSQSSPLYPINLWDDANCLLTVGRVMRAGGVLYRDVYEQKGPTLYALHALAAWVSNTSFFGVYLLETASLAAALFFAHRTLRLRMGFGASLACAALLGALTLTSPSFCQGDSAEELCLPLLMAAVYAALSEYGQNPGPMCAPRLFGCGLLAGIVATVKYTLLGAFVGLCLCEGALCLFSKDAEGARGGRIKNAVRLLRHAGAFLGGMALPIALWCAYFAANDALGDFFTAYFYNNIFLYDAAEPSTLRDLLAILRDNARWGLPTATGLACFACLKQAQVRAAMPVMAGCAAAALLFGRLWRYSPLALAAFAPVGVLGLWDAAARIKRRFFASKALTMKIGTRAVLCGAACALSFGIAWFASPNAFLRGVPLGELAQGRLAERIEPGATLLQYSHLDDGLYLTAGILPREKYFVRLNVRAPEMIEALDASVQEGRPDYVLVSWRTLPETFAHYELIAQDTAYDDMGRLNKMLYLYRRKTESTDYSNPRN